MRKRSRTQQVENISKEENLLELKKDPIFPSLEESINYNNKVTISNQGKTVSEYC